jgi:hypothetical protein
MIVRWSKDLFSFSDVTHCNCPKIEELHPKTTYESITTTTRILIAKMQSKTLTLLLLLTLLAATFTLATPEAGGAVWGGDKASSDVSIHLSPILSLLLREKAHPTRTRTII